MFIEYTAAGNSAGFRSIRRAIIRAIGRRYRLEALRWRIRSERRVLGGLSDSQLKDIGVHPRHASIESKRAYTDVPQSRLEQN